MRLGKHSACARAAHTNTLWEPQMSTNNVVVAVIGLDQPGIIACVSSVMTRLGCNIVEMTQSTLHSQFAGIYLVRKPAELSNDALNEEIVSAVTAKRFKLGIVTRDYEEPAPHAQSVEPFVVSVYGPDRNDIVGTFATLFGQEKINIEDLRALQPKTGDFMIVYEVLIPTTTDIGALHKKLISRAKAMGLNLTLQHRDIFEAIHRVQVV